jgi:heat shock protein HslJ
MNHAVLWVSMALLAGHEPPGEHAASRASVAGGIFVGVLPCADCAGLRARLQLRSDGAFVLETTRTGTEPGPPGAVLGAWRSSADGRTVELRRAGEAARHFAVRDGQRLVELDARHRPLHPQGSHDLVRSQAIERFQPVLRLEGTYRRVDGAGEFRECVSGARFPVATSGARGALDDAAAAALPGADVLVTVAARIAAQPSATGDRLEDALVVEKLVGAWPAETCGEPFATLPLAGTPWALTRLGGTPVALRARATEPHLRLDARLLQVAGFGGCNRFMGSYRTQGETLELGRIAATMMACPDRMDEEQAFLAALQAAARWRIAGSHLEVYDPDGTLLARFQARPEEETIP